MTFHVGTTTKEPQNYGQADEAIFNKVISTKLSICMANNLYNNKSTTYISDYLV